MGVIRGFVRMITYPVVRPLQSVREASSQLRADLAKGKEARAKHHAELQEKVAVFAAQNSEVTAEQLLNPALIGDPRRRFKALADLNGWTPAGLEEQLVAVRRGKRFVGIAAAVVFMAGLTTITMAPVWVVLVLSPCLVVVVAYGVASAFKYGLMQFQLEEKALYKARDYFSKPNFFSHLTW